MATTKRLTPCSKCGDPIWPSDLGKVFLSDEPGEDGMYEDRAYHKTCSPAGHELSA